jgi:hypothetical protein
LARRYAQNAIELAPEDLQARQVLRDVNGKALRHFSNLLAAVAVEPGKATPLSLSGEWEVERTKAENALSEDDLELTFEIVWGMIKKFALTISDGASD